MDTPKLSELEAFEAAPDMLYAVLVFSREGQQLPNATRWSCSEQMARAMAQADATSQDVRTYVAGVHISYLAELQPVTAPLLPARRRWMGTGIVWRRFEHLPSGEVRVSHRWFVGGPRGARQDFWFRVQLRGAR